MGWREEKESRQEGGIKREGDGKEVEESKKIGKWVLKGKGMGRREEKESRWEGGY